MLGKRSAQTQLFDVGNVYPLSLPESSFHGQLAKAGPHLFRDEDFLAFYCERYGRPSVPPSLLALMLLLQFEAGVSDEEAVLRTAYDLRWAAVLGRPAGEPLCAKSTFQLFRAHLVLHEQVRVILLSSIEEAKRTGLLKGQALRVALDTKPIDGRGAVLDTYNLLAAGIRKLASGMARVKRKKPERWMCSHGLERYLEPSIKGSVEIDWSDPEARDGFLSQIVADARQLLALAESEPSVREASELLRKLLLQDIEEDTSSGGEPKAKIKDGTARERIPSISDPEQRHGRKSKSTRFVGSKAAIAVDTDSQIILATAVLSGNDGDALGALELVEQAESNSGARIVEAIADCAYGSGQTREQFADSDRTLIAKVPKDPERDGLYPKSAFAIDLDRMCVSCPAGHTLTRFVSCADGRREFRFGHLCRDCPLQSRCTKSPRGRKVCLSPQEALLQSAREYQATPEGRARLKERVVVEHRLARLGQLGIGQARYVGRKATEFQLAVASAVANLRRAWNWERSQWKKAPLGFQPAHRIRTQSPITYLEALCRFLTTKQRPATALTSGERDFRLGF
jgi:hypothetical protein